MSQVYTQPDPHRSARPNFVIITSDQHRGDAFGFEKPGITTPHLDHMARNGTRFSTCITPSPVCQPARASILTGLYPKTHGVRDNGIDLEVETGEAGIAGTLALCGYQTGFVGKAHFSTQETFEPTGRPENRLSYDQFADDWCGPYMGFQHAELLMHYDRWLEVDGRGEEKRRLASARLRPDTDAARTWFPALPVAFHASSWVGDRAVCYIREHSTEPFFLWASFPDPHVPFNAPEPWSRLYDPSAVELPPHRELDLDRRPWWHRASVEGQPAISDPRMRAVRETLSRLPHQSDEQLRHIIAQYWSMISLIDHNVGRILLALSEAGLMENTIVVFTSDHGELLGDHGLLLKGPTHYEGLLRVGCVLFGAGVPHGVVSHPVSTVDLAPTIYDYAGVPDQPRTHGSSLRGVVDGQAAQRDHAFCEWELSESRCGVALDLATVRTARYKLTVERQSGEGELYDLEKDPNELSNRFKDPGYAHVSDRMLRLIESRPDDEKDEKLPQVGMA